MLFPSKGGAFMNKHTIGNLEARFSFTDRDGHQISGSYAKEDLATLLEYLGDYLWDMHPVNAAPDSCGGIVDTLKPITITIMRQES